VLADEIFVPFDDLVWDGAVNRFRHDFPCFLILVIFRGSTFWISPSFQMITGVPDALARLTTSFAACRKAAFASFVREFSGGFFMIFLRLIFDSPVQPLLTDDHLAEFLACNQPRRKSGRIVQPPAIQDRPVKPKPPQQNLWGRFGSGS
jgi:hypothetical protein